MAASDDNHHDKRICGERTAFTQKRNDYITWDEAFMAVSMVMSLRSKDPHKQVGACIVNRANIIVGTGYNGFPRGCSDDTIPWAREDPDPLMTKHLYVVHAEQNAIYNIGFGRADDCRIYTTAYPCADCAKAIIQNGIREVIWQSCSRPDDPSYIAARRMFAMAQVHTRKFVSDVDIALSMPDRTCTATKNDV